MKVTVRIDWIPDKLSHKFEIFPASDLWTVYVNDLETTIKIARFYDGMYVLYFYSQTHCFLPSLREQETINRINEFLHKTVYDAIIANLGYVEKKDFCYKLKTLTVKVMKTVLGKFVFRF